MGVKVLLDTLKYQPVEEIAVGQYFITENGSFCLRVHGGVQVLDRHSSGRPDGGALMFDGSSLDERLLCAARGRVIENIEIREV